MCFPTSPWFRAPGWPSSHSLLAGTVGSCPEELGALCCSLTSQNRKEKPRGSGGCPEARPGHLGGGGASERREPASGSWLCPEWLCTKPSPPVWSPSCLCQVLTWSLRPPPTFPIDLGSVLPETGPLQPPPLAGRLSSLGGTGVPFLTSFWKLKGIFVQTPTEFGGESTRKGTNLQLFS